ncbi:MAG: glutamine--fructose-6-phosphate aminotransferase [Canidatus Methanoxibalbensis ujae]|nr:glutamine--fructose-6-phosphate aminotransferase [Candidatus Methanoxibalbensis ujae]
MCGIIGYIGEENAVYFLLKGLKNLEYRGYDSAGIAVLSDVIKWKKVAGRVEELCSRVNPREMSGRIGIAHTRWATHGAVTERNAHPHFDCTFSIAVVHNGIIENHRHLKEILREKGHKFSSDTDSEVIAHLIEDALLLNKDFVSACMHAFSSLEGSFAAIVMKEGEHKIVGVRKDSPLVIGVSARGIFLASDIPSFLEWTNRVIYLHNYDMVVVDADPAPDACGDVRNVRDMCDVRDVNNHCGASHCGALSALTEKHASIRIYNLNEGLVQRPVDSVEVDIEQAKKGEFRHFMLKEITEQADTIKKAIQQDEETVKNVIDAIKNAFGIFFIGCGSSYHACLAGSYLFSRIAKTHVNAVLASEFENYEHFLTDKTLVFAVSQSGETADVLDAVRVARDRGSRVISIVNMMGCSLTRESDECLLMNAGPEICVLSTKTYTSQVTLMAMLAYALAGNYDDFVSEVKRLYLDIYNLTSRTMRERLCEVAKMLADKEHIYLIGRGLQYATALEAALKIKEVSYIHAEAFAGGELKHGPLALIDKGTPCIVFVSKDNASKIISNAEEVRARGGYIIGISSVNYDFDCWIKVPDSDMLNPVVQIIPVQILAYQLALLRGLDPDKPRNLAKSVTVT